MRFPLISASCYCAVGVVGISSVWKCLRECCTCPGDKDDPDASLRWLPCLSWSSLGKSSPMNWNRATGDATTTCNLRSFQFLKRIKRNGQLITYNGRLHFPADVFCQPLRILDSFNQMRSPSLPSARNDSMLKNTLDPREGGNGGCGWAEDRQGNQGRFDRYFTFPNVLTPVLATRARCHCLRQVIN